MLENSPVGESPTNGAVEQAVQKVCGMSRVIKDALEKHMDDSLPPTRAALQWRVMHTAGTLNQHVVGPDGKTATQRARGTRAVRDTAEFGERILYRPLGRARSRDKLDPKWKCGVFRGMAARSNEVTVADGEGVKA